MWLDLVQNLRNDHARLEGMQLEDQCVQHDGKTVNFRIIATLVNFHPSSSLKDIRILLTFFPLPVQVRYVLPPVSLPCFLVIASVAHFLCCCVDQYVVLDRHQ